MISRSVGNGARLLFLSRIAGRSTPMMGIDLTSFACRAHLYVFVRLGPAGSAGGISQ
jgi:hypothetical protein